MIAVCCAILEEEGKILLAQRSESMSLPLQWEFPGGKLETSENSSECIRREILEELGFDIEVGMQLHSSIHPDGAIELIPFICKIKSGTLHLAEHLQIKWVFPEEAKKLHLALADVPVLEEYISILENEGLLK